MDYEAVRVMRCERGGAVQCVRWSGGGGGGLCFSGGADRAERLWDPGRGALLRRYEPLHGGPVNDVRASPDGARSFASCSSDRAVLVRETESGRVLRRLGGRRGHDQAVAAVAFAGRAGAVLLSASDDRTVRAWDLRSAAAAPVQVLPRFRDGVTSVAALSDAVVAASLDGTVRTFDVRAARAVTETAGAPVTCVAAAAGGGRVLAACVGGEVREMGGGGPHLVYAGRAHATYRLSCAWADGGAVVAAASEDGHVVLWAHGRAAAEPTARLAGHAREVLGVDASPHGSAILSCGSDGTVRLWDRVSAVI